MNKTEFLRRRKEFESFEEKKSNLIKKLQTENKLAEDNYIRGIDEVEFDGGI